MDTLNDAVGFYHSLSRFGIKPGLERISELCRLLGDPQKDLRFVHVAGTNGKGTVCTEIASVLFSAGHKTGLYTSPYVLEFRERIRLNGEMIPETQLLRVTELVKQAVYELNSKGIFPTEFEAVTAAAFKYYADEKCDVVVLETGLGGRYDATNIITDPIVSVITSVSRDHMGVLGNSLAEIAGEKCGIIKNRCYTVTTADQPDEVIGVIRKIVEGNDSVLFEADKNTLFETLDTDYSGTVVKYRGVEIKVPFPGEHQKQNFAVALKALEVVGVSGIDITVKNIKEGIERAFIPARTEILSRSPIVILDGCHNDGSTKALAEYIEKYFSEKKIIAVMGMMADKEVGKSLENLYGSFSHVIAVTPHNDRALNARDFYEALKRYGFSAEYRDEPVDGIKAAFEKLSEFDVMIVCGSLYLAADVRNSLIDLLKNTY